MKSWAEKRGLSCWDVADYDFTENPPEQQRLTKATEPHPESADKPVGLQYTRDDVVIQATQDQISSLFSEMRADGVTTTQAYEFVSDCEWASDFLEVPIECPPPRKPTSMRVIETPPDRANVGESFTFGGQLLTQGSPLPNQKIVLSVNGTEKTQTTDSKGRWSFTVTPKEADKLSLKARFPGTAEYESSSTGSYTVNIGKAKMPLWQKVAIGGAVAGIVGYVATR